MPPRCSQDCAWDPEPFLSSVLHNGLGGYEQQLQFLVFSLSHHAPSSNGRKLSDCTTEPKSQHARPCAMRPYLNRTAHPGNINSKSMEEMTTLVQNLANQSGLDVIHIREPFHTDSPSSRASVIHSPKNQRHSAPCDPGRSRILPKPRCKRREEFPPNPKLFGLLPQ
jgi:large subunit ribosomal protein L43